LDDVEVLQDAGAVDVDVEVGLLLEPVRFVLVAPPVKYESARNVPSPEPPESI